MRRKLKHGILGVVGYVLSPLSWWNDLFVNIPLAYGFALLVALAARSLFVPALVFGYWATNVAGLVLLHRGVAGVLGRGESRAGGKKRLLEDLAVSVLYTAVVLALVEVGVLKPPEELMHWMKR
ncbi:MAG: hypothetical protein P8Y75_07120 [Nitrospirota bacterium]